MDQEEEEVEMIEMSQEENVEMDQEEEVGAGMDQEEEDPDQQLPAGDVVTFGTTPSLIPPRSLPASNKAINRRTANDFAGVPSGKTFACPVLGCHAPVTESWSIDRFYKHIEDDMHTTYFYDNGIHQCPFSCHNEYLSDFALHRPCQKQMCEQANKLFEEIEKSANSATTDLAKPPTSLAP